MPTERDHARSVLERDEPPGRRRPVQHRHRHVHQDDLRIAGLGEPDRLTPGRRRADDLEAPVLLENGRERVREDLVVVDHEHADRLVPPP